MIYAALNLHLSNAGHQRPPVHYRIQSPPPPTSSTAWPLCQPQTTPWRSILPAIMWIIHWVWRSVMIIYRWGDPRDTPSLPQDKIFLHRSTGQTVTPCTWSFACLPQIAGQLVWPYFWCQKGKEEWMASRLPENRIQIRLPLAPPYGAMGVRINIGRVNNNRGTLWRCSLWALICAWPRLHFDYLSIIHFLGGVG